MISATLHSIPDSYSVNLVLEKKLQENSYSIADMPFSYKTYYYKLIRLAYTNYDNLFVYQDFNKCFVCNISFRKFADILGICNGYAAGEFLKFIEKLGLISRTSDVNGPTFGRKPFTTYIYTDFF